MIIETFIEIGFCLGLMVNAALFIPQAIKIYRTKTSADVSLITFMGFNVIQLFVIAHAYLVSDIKLLFCSILSLITCGVVSILIIYYRSSHCLSKK